MHFLKSYWMFILLGITVVIVAAIGFLAFTRLSALDKEPDRTTSTTDTADSAIDEDDASPNRGELSFSIDEEESTGTDSGLPDGLACVELVAAPLEGSVPLTVTFTGIAKDPDVDTLTFNFDFGDNTSQSIDVSTTDQTGVESQDISHTYIEPGSFVAILTAESMSGSHSSVSCQIPINAGGVGELAGTTITPSVSTTPAATPAIGGPDTLTTTPAPTSVAAVPSGTLSITPTIAPSATLSITPTSTPAVIDQPIVPEAGSLLPTAAATIGGIAIIILAVLL